MHPVHTSKSQKPLPINPNTGEQSYDAILDFSLTIPNMFSASTSRTLARHLRQPVSLAIPPKWGPQSSLLSTSGPAIAALPQADQEKRNRSTWSKLLLFIPAVIPFGFGTWQIFCLQEKIKMMKYRQSRLEMEPLKGNEIVSSTGNLDSLDFRVVLCKGVYDEKKSILVHRHLKRSTGETENGYNLITPLIPVPGDLESVQSPILVNRGWVPLSWGDKASDALEVEPPSSSSSTSSRESVKVSWWHFLSSKREFLEEPSSSVILVEIIGVIRDGEKPNIFIPANDPDNSKWFSIDVPALARACGLPDTTLYVEDININDSIDPRNPYPTPKAANMLMRCSLMPQDHVNYIIGWYWTSAAAAFVAIKKLKQRL